MRRPSSSLPPSSIHTKISSQKKIVPHKALPPLLLVRVRKMTQWSNAAMRISDTGWSAGGVRSWAAHLSEQHGAMPKVSSHSQRRASNSRKDGGGSVSGRLRAETCVAARAFRMRPSTMMVHTMPMAGSIQTASAIYSAVIKRHLIL